MRHGDFTAKDSFNSAASGKLSEATDAITVVGVELSEKPDKDGVVTNTATIKSKNEELYSTVSASAIQQLEALADMFDDGDKELTIKVVHRTSGQGRDYIQLQLV